MILTASQSHNIEFIHYKFRERVHLAATCNSNLNLLIHSFGQKKNLAEPVSFGSVIYVPWFVYWDLIKVYGACVWSIAQQTIFAVKKKKKLEFLLSILSLMKRKLVLLILCSLQTFMWMKHSCLLDFCFVLVFSSSRLTTECSN